MTYYFRHPEYTRNGLRSLGCNDAEAMLMLQEVYKLDASAVFNLVYEGHIWQEG
jgi:hypothetical protein